MDKLGRRGILPVEVLPFALPLCMKRFAELGYPAEAVRKPSGQAFISDNGNPILRLRMPTIDDPVALDQALRNVPGVVGTGLFIGMADVVLIEEDGKLERRTR